MISSILLGIFLALTILRQPLPLLSAVEAQANPNDTFTGPVKFQFSAVANPAPWAGRYLHSAPTLADGSIVIIGGARLTQPVQPPVNSSYRVTDIWASSDRGSTWRLLSQTNPFISRFAHTASAIGQMILMIGGTNLDGQLFNDVWTSINSGVSWRQAAWAPFSQRFGHAATVDADSNTLLVTGGCVVSPSSPQNQWKFRSDAFRSVDSGQTWTLQTDVAPWKARMFHSVIVKQGIFYLAGGQGFDSTGSLVAFADVWQSINQGADWSRVTAAAAFGPRALALGCAFGEYLYIIGGTTPSASVQYPGNAPIRNDVWMSIDSGVTWTKAQSQSSFPARTGAALALIENQLFVIGGTAAGVNFADVWSTSLPTASTTSSGTIVAGILGSVIGLLILLLVLRKCGVRMNHQGTQPMKLIDEADGNPSQNEKAHQLANEKESLYQSQSANPNAVDLATTTIEMPNQQSNKQQQSQSQHQRVASQDEFSQTEDSEIIPSHDEVL